MGVSEDLKRAAEEVTDAIDAAVKSSDFSGLGRTVDGIVKEFADTGRSFAESLAGSKSQKRPASAEEKERRPQEIRPELFFADPESEQLPGIMAVVGGAMAVIFGLLTFLGLILSFFFRWLGLPLVVLLGIMTALSLSMVFWGRKASRKRVRFRTYRKLLLPKLYADIPDLAAAAGVSGQQAVADLEAFTREGKIRQGHFDDGKTCFIASDELYAQYSETAARARADEEARQAEARREEERLSPEVREILSGGEEYIASIRRANDEITDSGISDKLDRMERIVRRIFDEVRERPELAGRLNMFLNYYLPTTTKLMDAYVEMDRQPVQGENILRAKSEIAASLDTINDAFESLLDSLFREKAMDVRSDINVMKMMMKQDGLTEDDFAAMQKRQAAQASGQGASCGSGAAGGAAMAQAAAAQAVEKSV